MYAIKQEDFSPDDAGIYTIIDWNKPMLIRSLEALLPRYYGQPDRKASVVDVDIKKEKSRLGHVSGTTSHVYDLFIKYRWKDESGLRLDNFYLKHHLPAGERNNMGAIPVISHLGLNGVNGMEDHYLVEGKTLDFTTQFMPQETNPVLSSYNDKPVQIFPRLVDILADDGSDLNFYGAAKAFRDRRLLLLEPIRDKSLLEIVTSNIEKLVIDLIYPSLAPVLLLHVTLPERLAEREKTLPLKRLTSSYYTGSFIRYLQILAGNGEFSSAQIVFLEREFENASRSFVAPMNEELNTIVQGDGYPHHNMMSSLIDAGCLARGNRALQLGCLLGHPAIFVRLRNPKGAAKNVMENYFSKWRRLSEKEFAGMSREKIDSMQNELVNSIYPAMLFSNLKLAAGKKKTGGGGVYLKPYLDALEKQLDLLPHGGEKLRRFMYGQGILPER